MDSQGPPPARAFARTGDWHRRLLRWQLQGQVEGNLETAGVRLQILFCCVRLDFKQGAGGVYLAGAAFWLATQPRSLLAQAPCCQPASPEVQASLARYISPALCALQCGLLTTGAVTSLVSRNLNGASAPSNSSSWLPEGEAASLHSTPHSACLLEDMQLFVGCRLLCQRLSRAIKFADLGSTTATYVYELSRSMQISRFRSSRWYRYSLSVPD